MGNKIDVLDGYGGTGMGGSNGRGRVKRGRKYGGDTAKIKGHLRGSCGNLIP